MNVFKKIICLIQGHKIKRYRAPIYAPLSWPGWIAWSGVKCVRCYKTRRRKLPAKS